jgi:hypothetical protein
MMVKVRVEDAEHFYEEDEDPREVFAAFEAADKGLTAPSQERRTTQWSAKIRHEVAIGLRRLANLIEPSPHPH